MDEKTQVLVALGAAMGVNCIPCFDHIYSKAREADLDETEIKAAIEIADKVKNGAAVFLKNAVREVVGDMPSSESSCCAAGEKACC